MKGEKREKTHRSDSQDDLDDNQVDDDELQSLSVSRVDRFLGEKKRNRRAR